MLLISLIHITNIIMQSYLTSARTGYKRERKHIYAGGPQIVSDWLTFILNQRAELRARRIQITCSVCKTTPAARQMAGEKQPTLTHLTQDAWDSRKTDSIDDQLRKLLVFPIFCLINLISNL